MTGTTITPPFWGVVLGFAVVMAALFYGVVLEEQRAADEQDERRTRHVADDDIDTDWA